MTITAKIIADSISENNKRITTLQLRYPRFIHAEFMSHRAFSRNASSSRAIPVERMIEDVQSDTAMPIHWGANQKGMQADHENDNLIHIPGISIFYDEDGLLEPITAEQAWIGSRDNAIRSARGFAAAGYHKQVVNRLLEPFMHINVVVTATEWLNFFALRNHPAAQPEIKELAIQIQQAMDNSTPSITRIGDWHLPYVSVDDKVKLAIEYGERSIDIALKLSIARCASVSYMTVDGQPMTIERAADLCDKLLKQSPIHASPAEHQATPWSSFSGADVASNFQQWVQCRKLLAGECW